MHPVRLDDAELHERAADRFEPLVDLRDPPVDIDDRSLQSVADRRARRSRRRPSAARRGARG